MTTVETISSAEELRELLGEPLPAVTNKERSSLHAVDRMWLAASPFCVLATASAEGSCDLSPKGDPPGFIHVLDERCIAIPERPGNRRADSYHNILSNPQVSVISIIPGRGASLRIKGVARIVRDAPFFDAMQVKGHRPKLALVIDIETVFFHCAKAFLRSGLWKAESWTPDALPSHAALTKALGKDERSLEELTQYYGPSYAEKLYRDS